MKISKLIPIILILTVVLTACQFISPGKPKTTEAAATEAPAGIPYPTGETVALPLVSSNNEPYPSPGTQTTQAAGKPYPEAQAAGPTAANAAAYPGPGAQTLTGQSEPILPELKNGAEIQWSQVESVIFSGQVDKVSQTHDLKVYITLKDGRKFATVEPAIDDILKLVKACGELCKNIKIATE